VIRLVTLDPLDEATVVKLARIIYQAFGLGCEYVGASSVPTSARKGDQLDPMALLEEIEPVRAFPDDKVVYLTSQPLAMRDLPSGMGPTPGFAELGAARAVVSTHGLLEGEALVKQLAKQWFDIGHLWDLHHCLDPLLHVSALTPSRQRRGGFCCSAATRATSVSARPTPDLTVLNQPGYK
jgi:hypothetical protein